MAKKKLYFSDLVDGTGKGVKNSWDIVAGNALKKKAGCGENDRLSPGNMTAVSAAGAVGGFAVGIVTFLILGLTNKMHNMTPEQGMEVAKYAFLATSIGVPVATLGYNHAEGAYLLSKQNKLRDIEHEKKLQITDQSKSPKLT